MPFEKHRFDQTVPTLFVVILLGVAGGNLLSNWITAKMIEYRMNQAALELTDQLRAQAAQFAREAGAQASRTRIDDQAMGVQVREQRRNDRIGSKLAQACTDWTKAQSDLNTYTTRTERDRWCGRLSDYVERGALPTEDRK